MGLPDVLLRLAVGLLPAADQPRYRQEWGADVAVVAQEAGNIDATVLAANLVTTAPRMTMEMRSDSESGFAEWSVAMLASTFPAAVLAGLALYTQVWIMVLAELTLITGLFVMASGAWSYDDRLLESTRSRLGLFAATIGSSIEIYVRRSTGFGPAIDESASATIPHALIMIGLVVLVLASYLGQYQRRAQLVAVVLLATGAAANGVVVVINSISLSGFDRFGVLMYLVPSIALSWASYSIGKRPLVFKEERTLQL